MSDDIYQDYADAYGISRAEAKDRLLYMMYGGINFEPPPVPNINVGDRVKVTFNDGRPHAEFKVRGSATGRFRVHHPPMDFMPRDNFMDDILRNYRERAQEQVDLQKLGIFTGHLPDGCVEAKMGATPEGTVYVITTKEA